MVYASWVQELEAFEADCDRLRKARKESLPVKVLGFAPLLTVPVLPSLGLGRRLVALLGMGVSGVSMLMELDKHRSAYGGNLAVDLNASSDYDNLAGAFRSRSPRWEALCYLYSQLDPIHLKDRLGHLSEEEAGKALNRMVRRVQRGLGEVRSLNPNKPGYDEIVLEIADEWKEDIIRTLDRCLFKAGVIDREDVEDLDDLEDVEPISNNASTDFQETLERPSTASGLKLFDWTELENFPNRFPHLLLLGKTGAGKTTLAEGLLQLLPGDRLVISPHLRPSDFPGVKAIGRGRDYVAVLLALQSLEREMQNRYERYSKGDEDFQWLNVCIDEFPAITANCGKEAGEIMMLLAREARKVKIRLLILSQGFEVKALGIEGQGSVRECFTYIRLRGFVEDHARRLKDEAIARFISSQPYPCMVEDVAADSSVLASLEAVEAYSNEASTPDSWEIDEPLQLPPAVILSNTLPLSDDGRKLLSWLHKKSSENPDGFTLRAVQQGKPLGAKNHTQEFLQPMLSELLGFELIFMDESGRVILNR